MKKIKSVIFVDAQEMHKKHPQTFDAPSREDLTDLKLGDIVKMCANEKERFWTIITAIKGNKITASADNKLVHNFGFNLGDIIEFEKKNIYDIYK